ncbi:sarcospan [Thalassophryne amazonica]|uniref:sarcospan n=1 Tax=Thalassophryne amazonica TaxID=390379 RepID=UPI001471017A|nr:sarcospan [Thalassophryne amazonica]
MGRKSSSDKEKKGTKKSSEGQTSEDGQKCRVCRFPLLVALFQLLLGAAITVVAFLTLALSPSLLARETPHWAGIILCLIAMVGFFLYCVTYLPDETTLVQFIGKLLYFVLCAVGLVISVLVMAFAGHHHSQASSFSCEQDGLDCKCTLEPDDPVARTFTYQEVGCEDVTGTLTLYYLIQIILNLAQALVCAVGAFIMWKDRYQMFFAGLQIGSPSTQQWQRV